MASGPITSWQIDGETVETVTDFIFLGSKLTADGDCHHEIKRRLLLGRKAMTNLDRILKTRDIANKGLSSQSYGFSSSHVWMWQTIKKAECQKIDAFELCYWRRQLRVPWTARRSNQWILKEINPDWKDWCCGEAPILWPPDEKRPWKRPRCWERLKAGGEGDDRGWDGWMASPTRRTWVWVNSRSWRWTGRPGVLQSMGSQIDKTEQQAWTEWHFKESLLLIHSWMASWYHSDSKGTKNGRFFLKKNLYLFTYIGLQQVFVAAWDIWILTEACPLFITAHRI